MGDVTVWGIHAGRYSEGDSEFKKEHLVAIGWADLGDLRKIGTDREAYKAAILATYPETKAGAVPVYAGVLYRFVHEAKEGDFVIFPSKVDHQIHIGRIVGDYEYRPELAAKYPETADDPYSNVRPVKWLKSLPRTHFSQGALYEIGSALTLFQVKNYADDYLAALDGAAPRRPSTRTPRSRLSPKKSSRPPGTSSSRRWQPNSKDTPSRAL
jgi:restriction system protein